MVDGPASGTPTNAQRTKPNIVVVLKTSTFMSFCLTVDIRFGAKAP